MELSKSIMGTLADCTAETTLKKAGKYFVETDPF